MDDAIERGRTLKFTAEMLKVQLRQMAINEGFEEYVTVRVVSDNKSRYWYYNDHWVELEVSATDPEGVYHHLLIKFDLVNGEMRFLDPPDTDVEKLPDGDPSKAFIQELMKTNFKVGEEETDSD
jgi:hypothetical protein